MVVNKEQSELLTVREVARRCNRSEETIRRWIWSGKLPASKLGNQLFVHERDVAGARQREARMAELFPRHPRRLTDEEFADLVDRQDRLREELFKAHGFFGDSAELIRRSHEDH